MTFFFFRVNVEEWSYTLGNDGLDNDDDFWARQAAQFLLREL